MCTQVIAYIIVVLKLSGSSVALHVIRSVLDNTRFEYCSRPWGFEALYVYIYIYIYTYIYIYMYM